MKTFRNWLEGRVGAVKSSDIAKQGRWDVSYYLGNFAKLEEKIKKEEENFIIAQTKLENAKFNYQQEVQRIKDLRG